MRRRAWLVRWYAGALTVAFVAFAAVRLEGVSTGRAAVIGLVAALASSMLALVLFLTWVGRAARGTDRVLLALVVLSRVALGLGVVVSLVDRGAGVGLLLGGVALNLALWAWGRQRAPAASEPAQTKLRRRA